MNPTKGPYAVADSGFAPLEIEILHPKTQAFRQPEARPLHQGSHKPFVLRQITQDGLRLVTSQDHGQILELPGTDSAGVDWARVQN